tara:strand:- start:2032 stop:2508 length:477 start_codon:yes stop_codon:yes gene_type:complete
MNKILIKIVMLCTLYSVDFFWDLGVGIASVSTKMKNNDISLMTFNRLEGLKKYYAMDYNSAIYHFSQLNEQEQSTVLYEYIDCYYSIDQFNNAIQVLEGYNNIDLTENIIYLKSKIYLKLNLYDNALYDLNYLIKFFPNSDYADILQFEIEKINLLQR